MGIREDFKEVKKEVEEMKEQSFAMELLHDQRKQNKRLYIIIIAILSMWFATIGYLVYVLNDVGTTEETNTIDIDDVEKIDNSHIRIGDTIYELGEE